ncbi:MAG TPA: DUF58 domain-containing protein [Spirochaetia bacterium]|nr:DUF58 domain-containing protein [Spirochaetia bacterium]
MQINVRLIGVYIFCLSLTFLAGIYFGSQLLFIFMFLLFVPLVLVVATVIPFRSITIRQAWSASRPVRGEDVEVRLFVINRSRLAMHALHVEFESDMKENIGLLAPSDLTLQGGASHSLTLKLIFPYRGAYRLGVRSIGATDPLGFLKVHRKLETRPYLVYPQVHELQSFSTVISDVLGGHAASAAQDTGDGGNFVQLREYRDGESVRHIFWRKFASTGKPFLREYEHERKTGVVVYLDTSPAAPDSVNPREQQDTSIEIFLSLVKYLLDHGISPVVKASGNPELEAIKTGPEGFDGLLKASVGAVFGSRSTIASLISEDSLAGVLDRKIVVTVTHRLEPALRNSIENGVLTGFKLILNMAGLEPGRRFLIQKEAAGLFGESAELYAVEESNRIASTLEGKNHGVAVRR